VDRPVSGCRCGCGWSAQACSLPGCAPPPGCPAMHPQCRHCFAGPLLGGGDARAAAGCLLKHACALWGCLEERASLAGPLGWFEQHGGPGSGGLPCSEAGAGAGCSLVGRGGTALVRARARAVGAAADARRPLRNSRLAWESPRRARRRRARCSQPNSLDFHLHTHVRAFQLLHSHTRQARMHAATVASWLLHQCIGSLPAQRDSGAHAAGGQQRCEGCRGAARRGGGIFDAA